MSYPKRPGKPEVAKGGKVAKDLKAAKEAQQDKDKAYGLQQREELKGLLVNKFKAKYSSESKLVAVESIIASEVSKFLVENKLTEPNLKVLDDLIAAKIKEAVDQAKSAAVESVAASKAKEDTKAVGHKAETQVGGREAAGAKAAEPEKRASGIDGNAGDLQGDKKGMAARQKEMRAKMKNELDLQIAEKKRLQEAQRQKDLEVEKRQIALENELEQKDKLKERQQKQAVMQQKKEAQSIFECTRLLVDGNS